MVLSLDKGGILRAATITPRGTNTDTTDVMKLEDWKTAACTFSQGQIIVQYNHTITASAAHFFYYNR
jgi:hypothetical protein